MVELFAGPGGWSTGLRAAGYTGRAVGLEWDLSACRTAKAAGHDRICADVATYSTERFADVEGLTCSPPCQAWSMAGNRLAVDDQPRIYAHVVAVAKAGHWLPYPTAGWADDRSSLVLEVLRWVLAVRPLWFACEQVPDVLPLWRELARMLSGHGYSTAAYAVNAEEHGVPQTRRRAILAGSLTAVVGPPAPTHQRYVPVHPAQAGTPDLFGSEPMLPWVSMAEALGWGLPDRPSWTVTAGGTDTGGAEVFGNAACRRRLAQIVYVNGNRQNAARCPADQPAPTVMFPERSNKVEGAYERPATTVCGDPRIGRPDHKDRDKGEAQFAEQSVRVTVAEAAILQGFPADYPWQGTKSQRYRQVGDAIPVPLARAILAPLLLGTSARLDRRQES